ncbi:hypothetical protein FT663_05461 [Candidozyma haemuli var. vulneris]|uniref:Zn(2)-C6 fungal-type domain-containing protein n=1 Tax=Candidozyma haemuli TaxID=45357 RepID=A0A2V1AXM7_9ASCO|nr:hypothetical protein CXQ85_005181 [[Candida] haemuloni]KAF3985020.1 hypothetical protein FT663_05461 [[Candida] haemuloni var. vulneris]KAF3985512.1 hypothetical protein FT662_05111 [[Candida] haemuloni var. vulneris]PVH22608.1 hypothetical protein CXQ85_005181 [[Candida] haemuloni]
MTTFQDSGGAPPTKKFKRTYVACLNCRVRKVKCDLGDLSSPNSKCARCERERRDCVFVDSKKRTVERLRAGQSTSINSDTHGGRSSPKSSSPSGPGTPAIAGHTSGSSSGTVKTEPDNPKHFSTMEGALVFLANAAGKIASADERDKIDGRSMYNQIQETSQFPVSSERSQLSRTVESSIPDSSSSPKDPSGLPQPSAPFQRKSSTTSNSGRSGANDNGTTSNPARSSSTSLPTSNPPSASANVGAAQWPSYFSRPEDQSHRFTMPPAESEADVRPRGTSDLNSIVYIGEDGILTASEAQYLIKMFFTTMHPFYPHIPKFLHSPSILAGYPILLCAILTISSRYHSLNGTTADGTPKNIDVHDRLWLYVQRLISQTVWAEASTRSIGTVFAFLLFTEWNPRAIHWRWSDYANRADDPRETAMSSNPLSYASSVAAATSDEPAGLGAMRRSYRMAWMLIGSAVRLAQDTGFMEVSSKTFLATHVAEMNSVMNMSRRSMLGASLADVELDHEPISENDMEIREDNEYKVLNMTEDEQKKISAENFLSFTEPQKAQIELLQIMSLSHESLYGYKAPLGSLNQRQNLAILNIISPMVNNWARKYKHLMLPPSNKWLRKYNIDDPSACDDQTAAKLATYIQAESFVFEYNYAKLYIFSLALSPTPKESRPAPGKVNLKLDEISKSAKYIEQAFGAANEILHMAHRVHKIKMLRFMPVRWVTRLVRAVAFIVKCYLTITAHKSSTSGDEVNGVSSDNLDATILSLSLISVHTIVQSIQKAAITLRDCSPDELHLCTRYSNVLMYLCSEMRSKLKQSTADDEYELSNSSENPKEKTELNKDNQVPTSQTESSQPQSYSQNAALVSAITDTHQANPTGSAGSTTDAQTSSTGLNYLADSELMEWIMNNRDVGLDFVGPWTELIEQQLEDQHFDFNDGLDFSAS